MESFNEFSFLFIGAIMELLIDYAIDSHNGYQFAEYDLQRVSVIHKKYAYTRSTSLLPKGCIKKQQVSRGRTFSV